MSRTEQELMADFPDYHGMNYTNDLFKLIGKLLTSGQVEGDTYHRFYHDDFLKLKIFMDDNLNNPSDISAEVHKLYDEFYDSYDETFETHDGSQSFFNLLIKIRDKLNDINTKHQSRIIKLEVFIESYKNSGKSYMDSYFQYEFKKDDLGITWYDNRIHRIYDEIESEVLKSHIHDSEMNHFVKIQATYMDGHTDIIRKNMYNARLIVKSDLYDTTVKMELLPNSSNNEDPEVVTYSVPPSYNIPLLKSKEKGTFGILKLTADERKVLDDYREFIKLNGPFSFVTYNQLKNEYSFYRNSKKVINHATT